MSAGFKPIVVLLPRLGVEDDCFAETLGFGLENLLFLLEFVEELGRVLLKKLFFGFLVVAVSLLKEAEGLLLLLLMLLLLLLAPELLDSSGTSPPFLRSLIWSALSSALCLSAS